jgi:vacuolar-type H+-ATPase subunit I/STV1
VSILLALAAAAPIEVAQSGITAGSKLMSGVFSVGFLALVGTIWKTRVPMKKLSIASEEKLRGDLMAQLEKQDIDHTARVLRLESRQDDQKKAYENKLEYERVIHSNDIATMRHRMNNLDQCLTMLLALIETNPEKAQEAAKRVREMREKQEAVESAEKALFAARRATTPSPPL